MFDIGFLELLIIGIVALIVVGPKDLPMMFRTLGKFTAKARSMAREFSRAMENAAEEGGVGDIAKDLRNVTSSKNLGLDAVKDVAKDMAKWSPDDVKTPSTEKGFKAATLSEERASQAEKIRDSAAKKAQERLDREAAAEAADWDADEKPSPAKKPAAKKPAAKKPAAKKPAAKKPAAKKATAAKETTAKAPAKKPAAKKPAAKNPAAKKTTKKTGDA